MRREGNGNLQSRIIHAVQKLYCKYFGHNWSEWHPVKFSLFETKARHCQRCRLNETERPVPLASLVAHAVKNHQVGLIEIRADFLQLESIEAYRRIMKDKFLELSGIKTTEKGDL